MKTLAAFSILAFLSTVGLAEPKPIEPLATWQGSIDAPDAKSGPTRVITDPASFEKIWKDWKAEGATPKVDFKESFVIAETTSGSRLTLRGMLSENGDFRPLGMATRDLRPGFRYVLAQFPLAGIKSINGKPLAAPTLAGKVTCLADGNTIPTGATLTISLSDVSLADAPSKALATQTIASPEKFPVDYALHFDPATLQLEHAHFYSLSARIEKDGKLLFINDTSIPVSKDGKLLADLALPVIKVR